MTRTTMIGLALAAALLGTAVSASAWEKPGVPLRREAVQQDRIADGLASGALTGREYNRLERQQARIERVREHAWADGSLSRAERRRLTLAQNHASASIARLKHNPIHR
jgi:hypothetical protein